MFRKSLFLVALAAGMLIPALSQGSTNTASPTITITATVESYFEWDGGNVYTIDKDTGWINGTGVSASHIGKPGDVITATQILTVNTNSSPVFTLTALTNNGDLTEAGTSTTLTTSYRLSTDATDGLGTVAQTVSGWLPTPTGAGSAFDSGSTYTLTQDPTGQSKFNLEVKAAIPTGITLPKAANYTCTVKITAAWS